VLLLIQEMPSERDIITASCRPLPRSSDQIIPDPGDAGERDNITSSCRPLPRSDHTVRGIDDQLE
jgi:hypothetical protein